MWNITNGASLRELNIISTPRHSLFHFHFDLKVYQRQGPNIFLPQDYLVISLIIVFKSV